MASLRQLHTSNRILSDLVRPESTSIPQHMRRSFTRTCRRHASSTAPPPNKPIVLEQPDKFRPPSHGQRLVKGRPRPNTFGSGYNQSSTPREQEAQQTKRYPHTFPNEGTVMYKFLMNKKLHLFITLGTLTLLACISIFTTFTSTSPFAHLLPPLSSLLWHPISFVRECASVFKLHMDYHTQQVFESRNQNILDAQKRRLYRRAHGMEDLDLEYDQGVDVRGIAPWDDGLTKRERKNRKADWDRKGNVPAEITTAMLVKEDQEAEERERVEREKILEEERLQRTRKRKLWFGIW